MFSSTRKEMEVSNVVSDLEGRKGVVVGFLFIFLIQNIKIVCNSLPCHRAHKTLGVMVGLDVVIALVYIFFPHLSL